MYQGKIGQIDIVVESARGTQHPPVIATYSFAPGQGVLPVGLLLQKSASGLTPYDPVGGAVFGVNDRAVDTDKQDSGLVIIHGSALRALLKVGAAAPQEPDETQLDALISAGVYPE